MNLQRSDSSWEDLQPRDPDLEPSQKAMFPGTRQMGLNSFGGGVRLADLSPEDGHDDGDDDGDAGI